MNNNMERLRARVRGLSANALVMPIVVTVAVLHVLIISLIMAINTTSGSLSTIMQNAGTYTQDATSLLAGSSLLSETSSNFVLMPLSETGEINVSPLQAYAAELPQPRRGDAVSARFADYDVSDEARALIREAADSANQMLAAQLHALSLMNAVYPFPQVPPLTTIPLIELTPEEAAMTDAEKEAAARSLVLGSVYGLNKQAVSRNVNECVGLVQSNSARLAVESGRRVAILRTVLWVVTLSIVAILALAFATLYQQLLFPLKKFVQQIPENRPLNESKGFQEVRLVAASYNDVLRRRDALDNILRSAAETDALTNLPNRYRFEQYLLESEDSGYSIAMLLFDVNYLKKTNDTEGHLAGDRLIRSAAECISTCFGENCFRFGGDKFAAIVKNCTPESINRMVASFRELEREHNVSISLGYAYTDEISRTTFKDLLDEADKNMYAEKKMTHGERDQAKPRKQQGVRHDFDSDYC